MAIEKTEQSRDRMEQASSGEQARPDTALAVWMSWMESSFGHAQNWMGNTEPWWRMAPDNLAGNMPASGSKQLSDILGRDPLLRSIDQMWNANPMREIVPVDWAEIARALRTVWMLSLANPGESLQSAADLNTRLWQSAIDNWNEAGQRWLAFAGQQPADGDKPKGGDKRFAAPEWHSNPVYRTLKEMYLLASNWLIKHGKEVDGLDEAERQRLNFHLQQFVDAMSPTLLLVSNPAALRKALETEGASLAAGAQNLLSDLKEGRLSMVDTSTFAPGRNMATTPGKVILRNRLIELIQYEPTTKTVHSVPIMIMPPWINKFYILDLQPKNSMVKYLIDQGFTVFMVSWKNPDASMDDISFEDQPRSPSPRFTRSSRCRSSSAGSAWRCSASEPPCSDGSSSSDLPETATRMPFPRCSPTRAGRGRCSDVGPSPPCCAASSRSRGASPTHGSTSWRPSWRRSSTSSRTTCSHSTLSPPSRASGW